MRKLLNTVGWCCALGCAGISLTANIIYGFSVTSGVAAFAFAIGGACLDGLKTILPTALGTLPTGKAKVRRFCGGLLWVGLVAWSFFCAMQVYQQSRVGRVGQVEAAKLAYQNKAGDLTAARERIEELRGARSQELIQGEIDAAKLDRLYTRSSSCADATKAESRALCQRIAGLEGELAGASTAADIKGAIASETEKEARAAGAVEKTNLSEVITITDAGTQGLADMLGIPVDKLRQYLAVLFALLIEVTGGLGGLIMTGEHLPAWRKGNTDLETEAPPAETPETPPIPEPSPVSLWHTACVQKRKGTWTYASECWQAFNAWAVQNGYQTIDQTAFGTQMTDLKIERSKKKGKVTYVDCALLPIKSRLRVVQ